MKKIIAGGIVTVLILGSVGGYLYTKNSNSTSEPVVDKTQVSTSTGSDTTKKDNLVEVKLDGLTLSGVTVKNVDGKEYKVLQRLPDESIEAFKTRIGLKKLYYYTQFDMYVNSKMNKLPLQELTFIEDNIAIEFDKEYNISKVFKLSKVAVTTEQYLANHPEINEQLTKLKTAIDNSKEEVSKKKLTDIYTQRVDAIKQIKEEMKKEEVKLDKLPTFMELFAKLQLSKPEDKDATSTTK